MSENRRRTDILGILYSSARSLRTSSAEVADIKASRTAFCENLPASLDKTSKCSPVAFSGTNKVKIRDTGLPSGASKATGSFVRINAPVAFSRRHDGHAGWRRPAPSRSNPAFRGQTGSRRHRREVILLHVQAAGPLLQTSVFCCRLPSLKRYGTKAKFSPIRLIEISFDVAK